MSSTHRSIAGRHGVRLDRLLAVIGCAMMLSGCYTDRLAYQQETAATTLVASDYRLRHPIAIREGAQALEIFIGGRRGALTATQRSELAVFAHEWNREATGGVLIDLPVGTFNEAAAAHVLPEIRTILVAAGVPADSIDSRTYHPDGPA